MKANLCYKGAELEEGFFPLPHRILQVCDDIYDLAFLTVLAKCENRWAGREEGWFYIGDIRLAEMCKMSPHKLRQCRKKLITRALLECKVGSSHCQTQYHLTWASAKLKTM